MKKYILSILILISSLQLFAQKVSVSQQRKLFQTLSAISNLYVDTISDKRLVETTIKSLLENLDPHSTYIPKEEVQKMNEPLVGSFDGIGVQFQIIKDTINVVQTITGTPAEKVGVLPGDKIVEIEDTIVAGVGIKNTDILRKLRGKRGTPVRVKIKREFQDDLIVAFDNSIIELNKIKTKGKDAFGIPLKNIPVTEIKKKEFNASKIMEEQKKWISAAKSNLNFLVNQQFKGINFPDVQFETNTANIVSGTETGLEEVIDFMQIYPEAIISIEGHTDNVGNRSDNQKLSENRAKSVRDYLVFQGVDAKRVVRYKGFGETKPVASNNTEAGRAKNRRTEFVIVSQ